MLGFVGQKEALKCHFASEGFCSLCGIAVCGDSASEQPSATGDGIYLQDKWNNEHG